MIRIYGSSDDIVIIDAASKSDEVYCYDSSAIVEIVRNDGASIDIVGRYGQRGGVWSFEVSQRDEDIQPLPVRIEPEHAYSIAVVIDADPADVSIRARKGGDQ